MVYFNALNYKKGGRGITNPKGKILEIILIPKHV
jgi:hypothetical protein